MQRSDLSRRSVLNSIGAGAGAVSIASVGSAEETGFHLRSRYRSPDQVEEAVEEHASEVITELHERDILGQASVSALNLDNQIEAATVNSTDSSAVTIAQSETEGYSVMQLSDEGEAPPTALIAVSKKTRSHRLALFVQPEREDGYAVVVPKGNEQRFLIDTSYDSAKLVKSECGTRSTCGEVCSCTNNGRQAYYNYIRKDCYRDPGGIGDSCICKEVSSRCGGGDCSCSSQECGDCCEGDCGGWF